MIRLTKSLAAWGLPGFNDVLKEEVRNLEPGQLPLQAGLSQTSYVSESGIDVLVINVQETATDIIVKTGIYFSGIIAGSCCADDPTPVNEETEYCELQFKINKLSAETTVSLLGNQSD